MATIGITGFNGFLSKKIRERNDFNWTKNLDEADIIFHLGCPTFPAYMGKEENLQMYPYVEETIKLINQYSKKPFVFASTTGVLNIHYDHSSSMSYDVSKLFLENYVFNTCKKFLILRIGSIISNNIDDVKLMKSDRVQPRILNKDLKGIPFEDYYLDVNDFVDITIESLNNIDNRIIEYPFIKLPIHKLIVK